LWTLFVELSPHERIRLRSPRRSQRLGQDPNVVSGLWVARDRVSQISSVRRKAHGRFQQIVGIHQFFVPGAIRRLAIEVVPACPIGAEYNHASIRRPNWGLSRRRTEGESRAQTARYVV